jgi:protein-disulfide isomerase
MSHLRGDPSGHVIVEYGDYECPYSRRAYRSIQRVEASLEGQVAFEFRHFPLTEIHPHALAAACAAEAAALQDRFWEMHDLLFHRQKALEDADLRAYAAELALDAGRFDVDRAGEAVRARIAKDVDDGIATGKVLGTPTIFLNGTVHLGSYESDALIEALS